MATNDKILQQVALEGGDDIIRSLEQIAEAGQKAFSSLGDAVKRLGKLDIPTDKLKDGFDEVGAAGKKAFKDIDNAAANTKVNLGVEQPQQALITLAGTADTVFGQIGGAVTGTIKTFEELAKSIFNVNTALSKLAIGGAILGFADKLKTSVVGFATAFEKSKDTVDEVSKSITDGFNEAHHTVTRFGDGITVSVRHAAEELKKLDVKPTSGSAFEKRITDVDAFNKVLGDAREAMFRAFDAFDQGTDGVDKFQTSLEAANAAFKDMQQELSASGLDESLKNFSDLVDGFPKIGAAATNFTEQGINGFDEIRKSLAGLSDALDKIDPSIERANADFKEMVGELGAGPNGMRRETALANIAFREMQQELGTIGTRKGPLDDVIKSLQGLGISNEKIKETFSGLAAGFERQWEKIREEMKLTKISAQQALDGVTGAELNLASARERLNTIRGDKPDPTQQRINAEKRAQLELDQAELALQVAQKKASDERANSLENLIKLVNNLSNGVQVIGPKVNATAENIAKGFVAALGPNIKKLQDFDGTLEGINKAGLDLAPGLLKLADLFKGTGDAALNARIANILFQRAIDENVLKALSKGSKALEDARNLAKSIADLKNDFTTDNLEKFVNELFKIKDPAERAKKAVEVLGDTFGKALIQQLAETPGTIREAIQPLDQFIKKANDDITNARKFKAAIDDLTSVFTEMGVATEKGNLNLGLFLAPALTPIIESITAGIRSLNVNFRALATTIGTAVKPVIDDFFKVLAGAPDSEVNTKTFLVIRDVLVSLGEAAKFVAKTINDAFGTNLSAPMVVIGGLVTALLGGLNSLALAVVALFGSGDIAKPFKDALKTIGIDIDAIKTNVKDLFTDITRAVSGQSAIRFPWIDALVRGITEVSAVISGFLGGVWDAFTKTLAGQSDKIPADFQWVSDVTTAITDFAKSIPESVKELGLLFAAVSAFVGPGRLFKVIIAEATGVLGLLRNVLFITASSIGIIATSLGALTLATNLLAGAFGVTIGAALSWIIAIGAAIAVIVLFSDKIDAAVDVVLNKLIQVSKAISDFGKDVLGIDVSVKTIAESIAGLAAVLVLGLIPAVRRAAIALTATLLPALLRIAAPLALISTLVVEIQDLFNVFNRAEQLVGLKKELSDLQKLKDSLDPAEFERRMSAIRQKVGDFGASQPKLLAIQQLIKDMFAGGEKAAADLAKSTGTATDDIQSNFGKAGDFIKNLWKSVFGSVDDTNKKIADSTKAVTEAARPGAPGATGVDRGTGLPLQQSRAEEDAAIQRQRTKVIENKSKPETALQSRVRDDISAVEIAADRLLQGGNALADAVEELAQRRFKELTDKDKASAPSPQRLIDETNQPSTELGKAATDATKSLQDLATQTENEKNAAKDITDLLQKFQVSPNVPDLGPRPQIEDLRNQVLTDEQKRQIEEERIIQELEDTIKGIPQGIVSALEGSSKASTTPGAPIGAQTTSPLTANEASLGQDVTSALNAFENSVVPAVQSTGSLITSLTTTLTNFINSFLPAATTISDKLAGTASTNVEDARGDVIGAISGMSLALEEAINEVHNDLQSSFPTLWQWLGAIVAQLQTIAQKRGFSKGGLVPRFSRGGRVPNLLNSLPRFADGGSWNWKNRITFNQPNGMLDSLELLFSVDNIIAGNKAAQDALAETKKAVGGVINGPGTKTSDSILARLSRGEFVIKAAAVDKYGPAFFGALNNMQLPRAKFNIGGLVTDFGRMTMDSLPRLAAGGSTLVPDLGANSGSSRTLFIGIEGKKFGPFKGGSAVDELEKHAILSDTVSIAKKHDWYT